MNKKTKETIVLLICVLCLLALLPKTILKNKTYPKTGQLPFTDLPMPQPHGELVSDISIKTQALVQSPGVTPVLNQEDLKIEKRDLFDLPQELQKDSVAEVSSEGIYNTDDLEDVSLPVRVNISGIAWGQIDPIVFIDDKVYRIGDKITNDIQIIDINKKGVCFLYQDKKVFMGVHRISQPEK